jgi:hypothetical protein
MKNHSKCLLTHAYMKAILSVGLLVLAGWTMYTRAQETKPRIKLGAYYFGGWAGKCKFDDGTPENLWARGMPSMFTKNLATEFAGRMPLWGWRDDKQEIMDRQIDLAADNGVSYFSFCWYWADNKRPINVEAIEKDSKHLPINLFMQAKNNNRMEFSLLVANHNGFEIIGADAWKQAADYWINNYFKHPRYLCIDGKPVIVIYSPAGANKEGLAYLQEQAKKKGFPGISVVCCINGKPEDGFSLKSYYNVSPAGAWSTNRSERHLYKEIIDANVQAWKGTPEQPLIPLLTQGLDVRAWQGPGGLGGGALTWYFDKATPGEFEGHLDRLVQWMYANPTLITKDKLAIIYAWNEIGEGAWLVPCKDDPDGVYLKAIRNVVFGK